MKFAIEIECYGHAPDYELTDIEQERYRIIAEHGASERLADAGAVILNVHQVDVAELRYRLKREQDLHQSCQGVLANARADHEEIRRQSAENWQKHMDELALHGLDPSTRRFPQRCVCKICGLAAVKEFCVYCGGHGRLCQYSLTGAFVTIPCQVCEGKLPTCDSCRDALPQLDPTRKHLCVNCGGHGKLFKRRKGANESGYEIVECTVCDGKPTCEKHCPGIVVDGAP